jgi:hypothetical protein
MDLKARLAAEMSRRRARHPRYSLRAFARGAGLAHSTLVRLLREDARLTPASARRLGRRLGLSTPEIADACRAENDRRILALVGRSDFRADSRWLAVRAGLPLDDVNIALQRLLAGRRLVMRGPASWAPRNEEVS